MNGRVFLPCTVFFLPCRPTTYSLPWNLPLDMNVNTRLFVDCVDFMAVDTCLGSNFSDPFLTIDVVLKRLSIRTALCLFHSFIP